MDPLTLFALASTAVTAVKKGCQLYKDIKGAAGDVRAVLKDLEEQFAKRHPPDKPPTVTEKNQYIREKNRVIELNKKAGDTTNVYSEIGEHLGVYYDNYYKCLTVLEEEEKRSKTEVYTGDVSLGKRALQRVLMKKQLEAMGAELREIMVYQSPPELGALWTDVEDMMKILSKEQKSLIQQHIIQDRIKKEKAFRKREKLKVKLYTLTGIISVVIFYLGCLYLVVESRKENYPEFGDGWIPEKVSNYDLIISERNRKYWQEQEQRYKERLSR